jgi:hypothetical protein
MGVMKISVLENYAGPEQLRRRLKSLKLARGSFLEDRLVEVESELRIRPPSFDFWQSQQQGVDGVATMLPSFTEPCMRD